MASACRDLEGNLDGPFPKAEGRPGEKAFHVEKPVDEGHGLRTAAIIHSSCTAL
jgi:hypothetical protein